MSKTRKMQNSKDWNEHKLQTNFKSYMRNHNILNFKTGGGIFSTSNGQYASQSGWSDLIIANAGETLYVELKTKIGRLRETQIIWMNNMLLQGFENNIMIFHSDDWETFKEKAKELPFNQAVRESAHSYLDTTIIERYKVNPNYNETSLNEINKYEEISQKTNKTKTMLKKLKAKIKKSKGETMRKATAEYVALKQELPMLEKQLNDQFQLLVINKYIIK